MRLLLCLALTGCAVPTEPVVRRSADLTIAWDSTHVAPPRRDRTGYLQCAMRPDTSVIVVDGVTYLEIVESCY